MPKGTRGGTRGGTRRPRATTESGIRQRIIENATFQKAGNGVWDLGLPSEIGGAQILDETGSNAALRMGMMPDQKLYSMIYWGKDGDPSNRQYFPRLNDAKYYAKAGVVSLNI